MVVGVGAAAQMMCMDSHHFLVGYDELDTDVGGGRDAHHAEAKQSSEEGFGPHPSTWIFCVVCVVCPGFRRHVRA